jgi:phosphatidylserine decarboxylase
MASPIDDITRSIRSVLVPIHRAGWPIIGVFAVVSFLLFLVAQPLGWLGVILTAWCVYFFRDPDRVTPVRSGLVISPADGRVQMIVPASPPAELGLPDQGWTRVSIFLNVFDVHVNRAPADGTVERVEYRAGTFVNASLDKASEDNERSAVSLRLADGRHLAFVQIAGLVARRIICHAFPGQIVRAGERYGMIRFGSRVDVFLPAGVSPLVAVGQKAVAGETVIADLEGSESPRTGAVR